MVSLSQYHCCKNGGNIRTKKISAHTCHITYIITNIISDRCRVTWIIFRDPCFHFTNQVGAYIGCFCINTSANTGKQCDGFSTQ